MRAPDVPPHVSAAVARALSEKADERSPSVHDFVQAAMQGEDLVPTVAPRSSGTTVWLDASDAQRPGAASADRTASNTARAKHLTAKSVAGSPPGIGGAPVIHVRREGFVTLTQTVQIEAGVITRFRLTLELRP